MQTSNRRIWLGIILIALGSLFFLDNLNFFWFDMRHTIFSWHTIFLIIGIVILINHKNSLAGYIFLIIGLLGTARHFIPFFFNYDFGDLWPIILLFIGLWLILKRNGSPAMHHTNFAPGTASSQTDSQSQTSSGLYDSIDEVSVFNSVKKIITSQNFRGGKVTSIFGSVKLDLTNAKLVPGDNILDVTCIFGGVNIRVPQDWKVAVNVTSAFGGFDDKRFASYNTQTSEGVLVINGAAIFGGGELLY